MREIGINPPLRSGGGGPTQPVEGASPKLRAQSRPLPRKRGRIGTASSTLATP